MIPEWYLLVRVTSNDFRDILRHQPASTYFRDIGIQTDDEFRFGSWIESAEKGEYSDSQSNSKYLRSTECIRELNSSILVQSFLACLTVFHNHKYLKARLGKCKQQYKEGCSYLRFHSWGCLTPRQLGPSFNRSKWDRQR